MAKNVTIQLNFTCDECGKEKGITKTVNYQKVETDFEAIFTDAGFTLMPPGWAFSYGKANNYDLSCKACTNKWMKKNGFYTTG